MADYDNTNSGAVFKPFDTQRLILQGKLNTKGYDSKIVIIADQTKGGTKLMEVYQKVGVMFENDKKTDNGPDYTGPYEFAQMRFAAWKKNSNGNNYLSMQVSEPRTEGRPQAKSADVNLDFDDDVPF